jgi:hypothetical protein
MKLFRICPCCKKKKLFLDIVIGSPICIKCTAYIAEIRTVPQYVFDFVTEHKIIEKCQ